MSVSAISWAFGQPVPTTARFVLVAMADYADHRHICWPSVSSLMAKTGLGDRAIRNALLTLEEAGAIQPLANNKGGRGNSNRYRLVVDNPARDAGFEPDDEDENPAFGTGNPARRSINPASGSTNPAPRADKPRKNQEITKHGNQEAPLRGAEVVQPAPPLPDWLPKGAWVEWCEHRRQIKKPMTPLAAEKTIAALGKMIEAGEDVEEAISRSIASGWQGIFPAKRNGGSEPVSKLAWMRNPRPETYQ